MKNKRRLYLLTTVLVLTLSSSQGQPTTSSIPSNAVSSESSSPNTSPSQDQKQATSTIAFATPLKLEPPPGKNEPWWRSPVTTALFSSFIALINVLVLAWSLKRKEHELLVTFQQRTEEIRITNRLKEAEEQRKSIDKQLNEFYGPMQQLLAVSKDLAAAFKNGRDFSTLVELLEGGEYRGNDAMLLKEIMDVTDEIEKLIMTKSGLVESQDLRKILSRAVSHFRILRLASKGLLRGQRDRFEGYSFPVVKRNAAGEIIAAGLEQEVEAKIDELFRKREELSAQVPARSATT